MNLNCDRAVLFDRTRTAQFCNTRLPLVLQASDMNYITVLQNKFHELQAHNFTKKVSIVVLGYCGIGVLWYRGTVV